MLVILPRFTWCDCERRAKFAQDDDAIMDILKTGSRKANEFAEETLDRAKTAACLKFFDRELKLK